jgi:LysM domain-containing protein
MSIAQRFIIIAAFLALSLGAARAGEPPFVLSEDGATFLYRVRPGDLPATIAAMFGIPPAGIPGLLAANGISDPSRIATGQLFRIPNPVVTRAQTAEARSAAAERDLAAARTELAAHDRELAAARNAATEADSRSERFERAASLTQAATGLAALFLVACGVAIAVAVSATRMRQRAELFARTLADELEDKRRRALAERQESAKRIIDLEAQVQALKVKRESPGPMPSRRAPSGGR